MPKFARRQSNGAYIDVIQADSMESAVALFHPSVVAAWNAAGVGFVQVPDSLEHGGTVSEGGAVSNPPPKPPVAVEPRSVTRARFEALFAAAIGEVAFDDIMDQLAAIAAATPKTETSAKVKRALRALDAAAEIDYPRSDYKTAPAAGDLTAQFLAVVAIAVGTDAAKLAAIKQKIDAGLAAWAAAGV
jgi:hypothetical protein